MNIDTSKITKNWMKAAEKNYGKPFFPQKRGMDKINESYLAALIAEVSGIKYYTSENRFYYYHDGTGEFKPMTDHSVLDLIGRVIVKLAASMEQFKNIPPYFCTARTLDSVIKLIKGKCEDSTFFSRDQLQLHIHCANKMLEFDRKTDRWIAKPFSAAYRSRNRNPLAYAPRAKCPKFIENLLKPAMNEDDISLFQCFVGQCLLGYNFGQIFLVLVGMAGGGKSTSINIVEGLVGKWNCVELRIEHMGSRFEIGRIHGKTLLTGKDIQPELLSGSSVAKLKSLTGGDTLTAEFKGSNSRLDVTGTANVAITCNGIPRFKLDQDVDAWKRRIRVIRFERPPTKNKIANFDKILLEEEGSGILNWALEGATRLLKNGGHIPLTMEQELRVDGIIDCSRSFDVFADKYIHPTANAIISTAEAVSFYSKFCKGKGWVPMSERLAQKAFHAYMRTQYGASLRTDIKVIDEDGKLKNRRGYAGYQITNKKGV